MGDQVSITDSCFVGTSVRLEDAEVRPPKLPCGVTRSGLIHIFGDLVWRQDQDIFTALMIEAGGFAGAASENSRVRGQQRQCKPEINGTPAPHPRRCCYA